MNIRTVKLEKESLHQFEENTIDVIVFSTGFHPNEKYDYSVISNDEAIVRRLRKSKVTLNHTFGILKNGGLLFVYGLPKWLPYFAVFLDSVEDADSRMVFKHWIALDLDQKPRGETLPPAHVGLLMYLKSQKGKTVSPFHLNTKTVRIPYVMCKACGRNIKDWGGKKHLLNPLGAAVSDVWRDLPKAHSQDYSIPETVLNRIYRLVEKEEMSFVHVIEDYDICFQTNICGRTEKPQRTTISSGMKADSYDFDIDVILEGDSLEYMNRLLKLHTDGVFDLVFADPPYNLEKVYTHYQDLLSDKKYIQWSYTWLDLMSRVVRPGGALLVLNLPKYSTHYAHFLSKKMHFRHWIVWDAMSTPAGKIMPAHYSLLYFTKPSGLVTLNYFSKTSDNSGVLSPLDADYYCLRRSCIEKRKTLGNDDKAELDDIWWNIHRIKHKKYRDQHPCQLPIKLMERIIRLTTNAGDIVFDPFCGAGTTAIAAKMTGRHFVTMDIDEEYVHIAKRNLKMMQPTLTGGYYLPRKNKKYVRAKTTKKGVEIDYIELCKGRNRVVGLDEVTEIDPGLFEKITSFYKDFKKLQKIAHRRLEIQDSV